MPEQVAINGKGDFQPTSSRDLTATTRVGTNIGSGTIAGRSPAWKNACRMCMRIITLRRIRLTSGSLPMLAMKIGTVGIVTAGAEGFPTKIREDLTAITPAGSSIATITAATIPQA